MLGDITKTVDGLSGILNTFNPLVDGWKPEHEQMVNTLLKNGFTSEKILSLINVEIGPAREYINSMEKAMQLLAEFQKDAQNSSQVA